MAKCKFCDRGLANNKQVAFRCSNCGAVWCANGTCDGSYGKKQISRSNNALCQSCKKRGIIKV